MIVLFSGGTACRSITAALSRRNETLLRVAPSWDSGGSSKTIRERLQMLSIGDVRHALMTMAYGEGRVNDVVRICNSRISSNLSTQEALNEFLFYAKGRHPSLERMEPGLRGAILNYLKTFLAEVGSDFDFRDGSIGNFVLTGASLAHNGDVNTAIFVFRKLCGIRGNVWPSSLDNDLVLTATLANGRVISPQHAITGISNEDAAIGINKVDLQTAKNENASANSAVLEAIEQADIITFGPGSLFTSVLPHLVIPEISEAINRAKCPKILITNILECQETRSMTLRAVLETFQTHWCRSSGSGLYPFTHILANQVAFPFVKTVGGVPYLKNDLVDVEGCEIVAGEYEDVWARGQHDGEAIAERLLEFRS